MQNFKPIYWIQTTKPYTHVCSYIWTRMLLYHQAAISILINDAISYMCEEKPLRWNPVSVPIYAVHHISIINLLRLWVTQIPIFSYHAQRHIYKLQLLNMNLASHDVHIILNIGKYGINVHLTPHRLISFNFLNLSILNFRFKYTIGPLCKGHPRWWPFERGGPSWVVK